MVQMNYLGEEQRPQSNDPDYWDIWTAHGDNSRKADWGAIARDWQEAGQIAQDDVATVVVDIGEMVTANDDDELPF